MSQGAGVPTGRHAKVSEALAIVVRFSISIGLVALGLFGSCLRAHCQEVSKEVKPFQVGGVTTFSFLRTPIQVTSTTGGGDFVSRDTDLIGSLEQLDMNPKPLAGLFRAARMQVLLLTLSNSKRLSLNLEPAVKKRYSEGLRILGEDDDLISISKNKKSRQSVRTREVLNFLFEESDQVGRGGGTTAGNNVFETAIQKRSELNARLIGSAYNSVLPLQVESFRSFCENWSVHLPRMDNGLSMGAFQLSPPRIEWGSADGWSKFERPSANGDRTISGEVKVVRILHTAPYVACVQFLKQCMAQQGEFVKVLSPSAIETVSVSRKVARELLDLLNGLPSAIYLGRGFKATAGNSELEKPINLLVTTSGTFAFALEYEP